MRANQFTVLVLVVMATLLASTVFAAPMSDELRAEVSRIVILPVDGESGENVTGTYGKQTDGLMGGAAKGAEIGQIPVEVGHVPISIPIPVLREIGMLIGGLRGAAQRRTQDLHDQMSDDLATEVEQPLSNVALATDVFWGLQELQQVEPKLFATTTPIPPDTDAILYVHIDEVTLNIQKDVAIVSTLATARLQDYKTGKTIYRNQAIYADQDELKNWARNSYEPWREYREFARHFLGRELVDQLYKRVYVEHTLEPVFGGDIKPDKKEPWRGSTKSLQPTLDWSFELQGDNAGKEGQVTWDLEIYDEHRPVYRAESLTATEFKLDAPLEACTTYRWSVRPAYTIQGHQQDGVWMRKGTLAAPGSSNMGRAITVAHAYMQDFAVLDVDCKAK